MSNTVRNFKAIQYNQKNMRDITLIFFNKPKVQNNSYVFYTRLFTTIHQLSLSINKIIKIKN